MFIYDEAFQNKKNKKKSVNYIYENYFKHSGQLKTLIGIVNYTEYIKDGIRQNLIGKVKITNIKEILQYFDELSNKKIKNLILLSCRKINKKMSPKTQEIARATSHSPNGSPYLKSARHLRPPENKFKAWENIPLGYFYQYGIFLSIWYS